MLLPDTIHYSFEPIVIKKRLEKAFIFIFKSSHIENTKTAFLFFTSQASIFFLVDSEFNERNLVCACLVPFCMAVTFDPYRGYRARKIES